MRFIKLRPAKWEALPLNRREQSPCCKGAHLSLEVLESSCPHPHDKVPTYSILLFAMSHAPKLFLTKIFDRSLSNWRGLNNSTENSLTSWTWPLPFIIGTASQSNSTELNLFAITVKRVACN